MSKLYYEAIRAMPAEWITDELWVTELETMEKVIAIPHDMAVQVYKDGKWQELDIIHFGKNMDEPWPAFHDRLRFEVVDPPLFFRSSKPQDPESYEPTWRKMKAEDFESGEIGRLESYSEYDRSEACDHPGEHVKQTLICEKCGEEV